VIAENGEFWRRVEETMKRQFLSLAVFLMSAAVMTTASGQVAPTPTAPKGDFPEKGRSISLFVGYPAGGGADQAARLLASMMEKEIGTPISVVNKVGAGGQLGLTELVRAKPDGYTLGYAIFPFAATSYMDPRRQTIYKRTSFQPIAGQFENPKVVVVHPGSPYKTMKDLVDAAKANPEKVKAAAGGVLGDTHLSLLQLQKVAGIKLALVHFQGGADGATALLGGHVDMGSHVPPEILSHTKSGTLRALGVSGNQESTFFPGVKTLEAQGYPVDVSVVGGLIAPAGVRQEGHRERRPQEEVRGDGHYGFLPEPGAVREVLGGVRGPVQADRGTGHPVASTAQPSGRRP
jgi:tripartite-type tricarboxylate transporter receptor subunit TctC